jgi:HSP20 family protein
VHFDLAGIDPESIDLTVEQNVLTVKAERLPVAGEGAELLVSERPVGVFSRQLFLEARPSTRTRSPPTTRPGC